MVILTKWKGLCPVCNKELTREEKGDHALFSCKNNDIEPFKVHYNDEFKL